MRWRRRRAPRVPWGTLGPSQGCPGLPRGSHGGPLGPSWAVFGHPETVLGPDGIIVGPLGATCCWSPSPERGSCCPRPPSPFPSPPPSPASLPCHIVPAGPFRPHILNGVLVPRILSGFFVSLPMLFTRFRAPPALPGRPRQSEAGIRIQYYLQGFVPVPPLQGGPARARRVFEPHTIYKVSCPSHPSREAPARARRVFEPHTI